MLLTGFEGYGGRSDNPSAEIVRALDKTTLGSLVIGAHVLPVTNHNLRENITALIDRLQPSVVLCLGLSPGENMVRLERLAANYSRFEIKDNAGDIFHGALVEDGPDALQATLPLDAMLAAVLDCGIPARISNTAGTFLCNAVMYHALDHCAKHYPDTRCGFVHLPYMPSQVCDLLKATEQTRTLEPAQRSDFASMAIETQIEAVKAIIRTLA